MFSFLWNVVSAATQATKEKWIKVHFWNSTDSQGQPTSATKVAKNVWLGKDIGNVGHISAQTPNVYATRWPGAPGKGKYEPIPTIPNRTLAHEIRAEGHPPETTTFHTLNQDAFEKKYTEMEATSGWGLYGPKNNNDAQSCATATYLLMRAAGIDKLSPKCACIGEEIDKKIITPIEPVKVQACILDAKKNEEKLLKETDGTFSYSLPMFGSS